MGSEFHGQLQFVGQTKVGDLVPWAKGTIRALWRPSKDPALLRPDRGGNLGLRAARQGTPLSESSLVMTINQNESLGTGAPTESGDMGETATEWEKANAAALPTGSTRRHRSVPTPPATAATQGRRPFGEQRHGSAGVASQPDASARHATENLPQLDRTLKR
jgi:hypothetical protein